MTVAAPTLVPAELRGTLGMLEPPFLLVLGGPASAARPELVLVRRLSRTHADVNDRHGRRVALPRAALLARWRGRLVLVAGSVAPPPSVPRIPSPPL